MSRIHERLIDLAGYSGMFFLMLVGIGRIIVGQTGRGVVDVVIVAIALVILHRCERDEPKQTN